MPKDKTYVNRELRWLSFNERVLMTAENPRTPLLERLKFLGIFSSNMDEFYAVRIGSLHRMILDPTNHPSPKGSDPKHLLKQILQEVKPLNERFDQATATIFSNMARNGIEMVDEHSLSPEQTLHANTYFRTKVRNRLFPILLDPDLPFPYLKHVAIYLSVHMWRSTDPKDSRYALMEIPVQEVGRYVSLPQKEGKRCFLMLDDLIRLKLEEIFSMFPYDRHEAFTIKITRDSEYELGESITKSLYEKLSTSIKQRNEGDPIRFVYDRTMPKAMLDYLLEKGDLASCRIILSGGRYHNARDFTSFPKVEEARLYFSEQPQLPHHALRSDRSLLSQIAERDFLISLPYHRYDSLIDLLREASLDATVQSIKMTLYRVTEHSSVINALRNAARNGKDVTLFIELQARFDEEINMHWTEKLTREHNINLIRGVAGMKVHAKIAVITRKIGKEKQQVALIGTGNFNEVTARLYSDHILLTANPKLTREADRLFKLLEQGFADAKFKHLVVSPFRTRKHFLQLIREEGAYAKKGEAASIVLKMNNLVDPQMIKALLKAAGNGVHIVLMIRGICSLSVTEDYPTIEGKAMIDRYLEHTRIIKFHHGGDPLYFLGSADWMARNLDNRIEVMTPIYDSHIKEELDFFLRAHWNDTYASFSLQQKTFNQRLTTGAGDEVHAQREIWQWYALLAKGEEDEH